MTAIHGTSPLEAYEFALTPSSTNRGLARRLMDQTLRPPEREYLEHVETIAKLEDEGLKYPAIADAMGWAAEKIQTFVKTEKYRLFRKYVADRALLAGDQQEADRRRAERRRWNSNGGRALDYYDQAFRRHPRDIKVKGIKQGDFVDMDRAERAANLFARSAGWTEPTPAHQKPKELKGGIIQAAMAAIAAADKRELVVRVTQGDTTVEVGSRETATMGGEG